jgi:hypothetical protein
MRTAPGYPPLADAYRVRATRWTRGWELYISDLEYGEIGATNTVGFSLAEAEHMVRDYLATVHDLTESESDALSIEIVAENA